MVAAAELVVLLGVHLEILVLAALVAVVGVQTVALLLLMALLILAVAVAAGGTFLIQMEPLVVQDL
jgi:hypothetical protein